MPRLVEARRFASAKSVSVALGMIAVTLVVAVIHFFVVGFGAIRFPFGIDYGEGIVWQQMRMIMAGHGYAPLGSFPAIVFHYPPLYHVLTGLAARATDSDELATGRAVSLVSTIAAAALLAVLTSTNRGPMEPRLPYRLGGLAAAAIWLATQPVMLWAYLFRVDPLFLAFSFGGVWLGILSLTRPIAIYGAALLFVAALFTKQTALAAPSAVFAVLLVAQPRTAAKGIITGLVAALAALAAVVDLTHGGFLKHIILYNINRFDPQKWSYLLKELGYHCGLLAAALWAIRRRWKTLHLSGDASTLIGRLRSDPAAAAFCILVLYFLLTTIMLGLVFKSGSALNYFLEWLGLVSSFVGLEIADMLARLRAPGANAIGAGEVVLLWALALQLVLLVLLVKLDFNDRVHDRRDLERLQTLIVAAPRPVIGDDMVAILRAGKPVLWEPSIFTELAAKGVWDERPFLAMIRAHRFAFFVSEDPGSAKYDSRHSPGVRQALAAAYPQVRYLAQYELRFPAGPLPADAASLPRRFVNHHAMGTN